jgi:hypothetical protein
VIDIVATRDPAGLLTSPEAAFIAGQLIVIDGGITTQSGLADLWTSKARGAAARTGLAYSIRVVAESFRASDVSATSLAPEH